MGHYPGLAVERAMKIQEVILRAASGQIQWWQGRRLSGAWDALVHLAPLVVAPCCLGQPRTAKGAATKPRSFLSNWCLVMMGFCRVEGAPRDGRRGVLLFFVDGALALSRADEPGGIAAVRKPHTLSGARDAHVRLDGPLARGVLVTLSRLRGPFQGRPGRRDLNSHLLAARGARNRSGRLPRRGRCLWTPSAVAVRADLVKDVPNAVACASSASHNVEGTCRG